MALYCAVRCLIFKISLGRYQHRGHHSQRTKGRGNHVTHNISVIIFAGPDKTAFCFHHSGYCVVYEGIEISQSCFFKGFFIFSIIDFLENIFKGVVILFGNGILSGKPQILLSIQSIRETTSGKTFDRLVQIVHTLQHTCALKFVNHLPGFGAVLSSKDQFCLAGARYPHFCILVHIPIGMSGQGNRLLPVFHTGFNAFYNDGRAEHSAVQHGTNGSVGTFVHFF